MAILTGDTITWGDLVAQTKANLKLNIENLTGNTIPSEFKNSDSIQLSSKHIKTRDNEFDAKSSATSNVTWNTVDWSTVEEDFDDFLDYHKLNSTDRENQLVSTRLILNFFENVALFYTNRLLIVYSNVGNKPKKLYYYDNGAQRPNVYNTWAGKVNNIEDPVVDSPVTADELNIALTSLNNNLKNKVKTYEQTYSYETVSCSCSSSSSSCSSSCSSCCSCLTIVHQDLSML